MVFTIYPRKMDQILHYLWNHMPNLTTLIAAIGVAAWNFREKRRDIAQAKRTALEKEKTDKQEAWGENMQKVTQTMGETLVNIQNNLETQIKTQNLMNARFDEKLGDIKEQVGKLDNKIDIEIRTVHQRIDGLEGKK